MDGTAITIDVHETIGAIGAAVWDACACPEAGDGGRPNDPFTTYRFLKALEDSGSVGPGTGWRPYYLTAETGGQVVACAPLYLKTDSQGEYIFDFNWAHAFERAGGRYYPKLQIAVPFTPVTGRRLLTRPGFEAEGRAALIGGAVELATRNKLSSLHITFCTGDEVRAGSDMGLMARASQQFHWLNEGYGDFADFLARLSSRKRKAIRRERRQAGDFGGDIRVLNGARIEPRHWRAMWDFYQDTGARKWGRPYLTRDFFDIAAERLCDDVLMVMAERDGLPVAGALNLIGREALFGRYWGCSEHHPCLHFELCYYRAMDFAIEHGLARVEAGAQGEHKLARGYLPRPTYSLHWIADGGFAEAVGRYLEAERAAVDEDIEVLTGFGPFRRDRREERE
ncbi:MAG: GNAT family N-acetyltransferase [Roseovarius sp.]|nr:GNAT family N-acetyltransferase [Roseovarius sp.]